MGLYTIFKHARVTAQTLKDCIHRRSKWHRPIGAHRGPSGPIGAHRGPSPHSKECLTLAANLRYSHHQTAHLYSSSMSGLVWSDLVWSGCLYVGRCACMYINLITRNFYTMYIYVYIYIYIYHCISCDLKFVRCSLGVQKATAMWSLWWAAQALHCWWFHKWPCVRSGPGNRHSLLDLLCLGIFGDASWIQWIPFLYTLTARSRNRCCWQEHIDLQMKKCHCRCRATLPEDNEK